VPLGSAPEFSQTYTDLALVSRLRGTPADDWLALEFGANNMHGIEDLGNQIHCTLLGIPEFFLDAKITLWETKLKGFFSGKKAAPAPAGPPASLAPGAAAAAIDQVNAGKCAEVDPSVLFALGQEPGVEKTDTDWGALIIANHHRLLEDFFQREYEAGVARIEAGAPDACRPEVRNVYARAKAGDPAFEKACRAALAKAGYGGQKKPGETEFARVIAETMVEASAPEAAPIYRAIRKIAKPDLRRGGVYPADTPGTDPHDYVLTTKSKETDTIFELHARAFARVITALRLWQETFDAETTAAPGSPEAAAEIQRVVDRLVARQLQYLSDAKARRDTYLKQKSDDFAASKTPGLAGKIEKALK
jgi:hypothetical protein